MARDGDDGREGAGPVEVQINCKGLDTLLVFVVCGGVWRCVVVCGGVWWCAVVCV